MKYCIHCGAPIKGNAAVFRSKHKKPIKKPSATNRSVLSNQKQPQQSYVSPTEHKAKPPQKKSVPQAKNIGLTNRAQSKKHISFKYIISWLLSRLNLKKKKKSDLEYTPIKNPMDENYDGYYDDKPIEDEGQNKKAFDPEQIKRIVYLSCGGVIIIILAIVIMTLL